MNFVNIEGYSNITWTSPTDKRNWDATFSGSGNLFSLGAGAEYKLWKNLWLGASADYTSGKIKTKGTQLRTQLTAPGVVTEYT